MSRTAPRLSLWFSPTMVGDQFLNVEVYDENGHEYVMRACSAREAALVMDALDAMDIRFGHIATRSCFCEARGIGQPGVSCGDCWRDYTGEKK